MLSFARSLAQRSGELLLERLSEQRSISFKSTDRDLVTDADQASERLLVSTIQAHYPDHAIVGEEGTGDLSLLHNEGYTWVLDPLDGTVNYANRLPVFCVSVGLFQDGEPLLGAVYAPLLGEMYCAQVGQGATLNDEPLHVSQTSQLKDAILATGFPYDKHSSPRNNLQNFNVLAPRVRGIRRMGAAAMDLCFVASGRLDGYWEEKVQPWDIAAGVVIVREAGGTVTDYGGYPLDFEAGHLVASNGALHPTMLALLEPYARHHHLGYPGDTSP